MDMDPKEKRYSILFFTMINSLNPKLTIIELSPYSLFQADTCLIQYQQSKMYLATRKIHV